ncbi:MAG TPA: DUF6438 domain-containing protein [Gemmatimonadaceae bacterium]|nr:DUF6438 domain-containing protein [Gemmatimonadaceae bacterium]
MRAVCTVLAGLALIGCHPAPAPTPARPPRVDSLILERSPCFGFCPAYRLTLHADGSVTFGSRDPGDVIRMATDTIPAARFEWLVREAHRIGFGKLPAVIAHDSSLCPVRATDQSTATVTIVRADSMHRVVDYHGCYAGTDLSVVPAVGELRHFESEIDSVAQTGRWLRRGAHR